MSESEWLSRTPQYVGHLQEVGVPPKEIERIRINTNKIVGMGFDDTLSDYFHHEALNSFTPFVLEVPNVEFSSADFQRSRQRLLNIGGAFDWFKKDGPLSRQEITDFLAEAEKQKEWNPQAIRHLNRLVQPLLAKVRRE